MPDTQTITPPPPPGYTLNAAPDSDLEQPIASVRTSGDSGQNAVPPPPRGYSVNKSTTQAPPSGYTTTQPPMTRPQADEYLQTLAAGGTKPVKLPKPASFADTALVDPESPVFGEPIKSSVHPDTRGGRNLVPVQDVAATRQQMQYEAQHPDEMTRVAHSQAMDTSLPLAERLANRAGLEARKRTELGQAVSNVNDRWKQFAGNKGADAGEAFAQFMARHFQTENPQATPREIGVARSVGKNVAVTAVDPVTHATIVTGGVGGKVGQVALSSLFAAGAAKGSYDAAGQLGSIWDRPDVSPQEKAEMASDLVLNTAMAGFAGAHAVKVPFIKAGDPFLSKIPQEYRDAVTQKINSTLKATGGVLSRAASTAGDVAAEVANTDRENVPTQGATILRRAMPKVPAASVERAFPIVRALADHAGFKTITAEDLLDSQPDKNGQVHSGLIGEAKKQVLAQAGRAAGEGRTIADLSPQEAQPYIQALDALDDLHDHIQAAQEKETAELKKAAEKGKIPATKAAALLRMGMGAGKVAISTSAGPALGRMSRVLLHAYGIPSGFNDLVTGVKSIIGAGGKVSPSLDETLNAAMGRTRPADIQPLTSTETREPARPYQGDTTVKHDSLIFPPETPHGDANVLRDEPNPRFQLSSSSTAEARPQSARASSTAQRPLGGKVGEFTSVPSDVTPERQPKQIPLTTSTPGLTLAGQVTIARPPEPPRLPVQIGKGPGPRALNVPPVEIPTERPAGQARNPQNWQESARASIQSGRIPDRPLTTTEMKGYLGIPESVGPREVEAAGLVKRNPSGMWEVQQGARATQPSDIFPNQKALEDWLQQQEDKSPRIQQARQRAQAIRDAREAPAQNPGDVIVPRGQHPESIVERALMKLGLPALREAARAGDIDYSPDDTHQDLIGKIMDAYAGQDEHLENLAETLQGRRGAVPAGPRQKAPVQDEDFTDVMARSVEAANARKAATGGTERRQQSNASFRETLQDMSPAEKDAALEAYHQRERTSQKTGLPNELAFTESAATLGKSHPHVGFADADDFKLLNDTFDHKYVDEKVLRPIGDLMAAAVQRENGAVHAFHISGDEFTFRASDPAAITRVVNYVNAQMAGARFELQKPDGNIVTREEGVGLSHGTGRTQAEAENNAAADKTARRVSGQRTGARDAAREAAQNQNPATSGTPQGKQNSQGDASKRQGLLSSFASGSESSSVRPAASLRPGDAAMVPTAELNADPARFQYKGGTNEQGVTNALKEQNSYDQNKGGVLLVWKDPANGRVYVVNGHHRFELAQRAGEENVLVRMIDAPDAEAAKVIGAETNISEGHGSIVDAARFFKSARISTVADAARRNLPMGQAKVTDGLAMARLDNSILDRVESGDIPEGRAVAIGKITDSPAQQDAILKAIAKREARTSKPVTNGEAESIARQVKDADTHVEQGQDLFGAFAREESLFGEQAEIDDYILRQLRNDKRTFGAVASKTRAETLGKVKNQQINAEENQRISEQAAQAEALYNKLVNRAGTLNEIRKNAAKRLAGRDGSPQEIKAKAYERIRQELQGQLGAVSDVTGTEGKRP